ncbi:MAG: hypothetical protein RLZZ502_1109 [Pseudomonadota bacterium]|jgi:putative tricarboxylic transport membrane protein
MKTKPVELLITLLMFLLAGLTAWQAYQLPPPSGYSSVGPRFFPGAIAAGLALCGALLLWQALNGGFPNVSTEASGETAQWSGFYWIIIALVTFMLTAKWGGFPLAGMLLFAFSARAFGSQQLAKDLGIGFGLALAAYLFFAKVLSVQLPAGVLAYLGL